MKNTICLLIILCIICACGVQDNKKEKAIALFEKGQELEQRSSHVDAINFYYQAINLLGNTNEHELLGDIYNHLGDLFRNENLFDRAIQAHENALKYNRRLQDKTRASQSLRGIGKDYGIQEKSEIALTYFIKAAALSDQISDNREIALIHNNLATAYGELKKFHLALKHTNMVLQSSKDSLVIYRNYLIKGDIFEKLHQDDSACYYYKLGSLSNDIYIKAGCYNELSEKTEIIGIANAYEYKQNYQILKDSIDRIRQTTQIEKYESWRIFKKEIIQYKNGIIILAIVGLFVVAILQYRHKKKIKKQKIDNQEQILLIRDGEVQNLRKAIAVSQNELKDLETQIVNTRKDLLQANSRNMIQQQSEQYALIKAERDIQEKKIISVINKLGDNCGDRFRTSGTYSTIKEKIVDESSRLNYDNREILRTKINGIFEEYIIELSIHVDLSNNDCLLCCLSLCKFSNEECASCFAVDDSAIRSRKSRIRKKIKYMTKFQIYQTWLYTKCLARCLQFPLIHI